MKHIILVGACYLDTILRQSLHLRSSFDDDSDLPCSVPLFPAEDSKLRATSMKIRRGGNCPNSLEVMQQLLCDRDDLYPYLVSCLPHRSSPATRRVVQSFGANSRVDLKHCLHREAHTEAASSYIVRSEETGSRTLVNYNDLPDMTTREFEDIARTFSTDQQTWWHFEGRIPETTLECIRILRRLLPAARISVEVEKPGRDGLSELAAEADVVFYSRSWAESRGHESAEACLRKEGRKRARLALCTWGADGAAALSQDADECIRCPVEDSSKDISVTDSVGAGDTFIAGMLYGMTCRESEWDVAECLKFAVKLATLKVQREGFDGLGEQLLGPGAGYAS